MWPFAKDRGGYSELRHEGRVRGGHAVMCEITHGAGPEGHEVAHSCGVRHCINHRHLRWATRSANCLDRRLHGTARPANAKLTQVAADEIRAGHAAGVSQRILIKCYGVSQTTVSQVIHNHIWVA